MLLKQMKLLSFLISQATEYDFKSLKDDRGSCQIPGASSISAAALTHKFYLKFKQFLITLGLFIVLSFHSSVIAAWMSFPGHYDLNISLFFNF